MLLEVDNLIGKSTCIAGIMIRGDVHVSEDGAPFSLNGTLSIRGELDVDGLTNEIKTSLAPVGINPKK